ncbi:MAG: hypothetical protein RTU30_12490 [Candidatus Thorarchaeota archaeon]
MTASAGRTTLRVYIKSESKTVQAADMETISHPQCTGTRSPVDSLGKSGFMITQDQQILLDAVTRAADRIDAIIEIVDVSQFGLRKRLSFKGDIPRIEIGSETLTGIPTSDEIVEFHRKVTSQ